MAALDFPSSPSVGQTYPAPAVAGQPVYTWDGEKWTTVGGNMPYPQGVIVSDTPPPSPIDGQMWFESDTGNLYIRYNDGNSTQWVAAPPSPDTSKFVRTDVAQGLNYLQQAQGRSNIGVLNKNYIINGAMMISQENGSTAGSVQPWYPVDQFYISYIGTASTWNAQQAASVTPAGSPNRLRVTATGVTAPGTTPTVWIEQRIEGLRTAALLYGSATAKATTLQFGVKGPAGTYSVVFSNLTRSYVAEYVIAAGEANTDVVKSVVIPGDVTGTWVKDNTAGVIVRWALMTGSNYQLAVGSWVVLNSFGSPNQFNFLGTNGNVFELFDVSLTEGNVAPPFMVPDYASELLACQRYYYKRPDGIVGYYPTVTAIIGWTRYPVYMRAAPTLTATGGSPINTSGGMTYDAVTEKSARRYVSMAAGGQLLWDNFIEVATARL